VLKPRCQQLLDLVKKEITDKSHDIPLFTRLPMLATTAERTGP
jgi:hypothetical protein